MKTSAKQFGLVVGP